MSRIDDELEQALRDGDRGGKAAAAKAAVSADEASPVVADARERKGWGLLAVLLALAGGVLALVFSGGEEAVVYSYKVDEVKTQAAQLAERQVRVQGSLVSGSLVRRDNPCEYRFMMRNVGAKTGEALEVRYPLCVVPDTFRDVKDVEVEVTAEGRLGADGQLQATKIFAKCPSKYEMRETSAKNGGQRPEHNANAGKSEFIPPRIETAQGVR